VRMLEDCNRRVFASTAPSYPLPFLDSSHPLNF
jgi:hypothetical protein